MRLIQALILALCAFACSGAGETFDEPAGKSEQAASTPCEIQTLTNYACQPQFGRPATSFKIRARNAGTVSCSYYLSVDVYSKPLTSPPTKIAATPVIGPYTLAPGSTKAHTQTLDITGPMFWEIFYRYRDSGTSSTPLTWHNDIGGPYAGPPPPPVTCSDYPPI
jgi:hypothetical protein